MSDRIEQLKELLARRIVVLDGSWGVLIQREVRGEEAYRGERFKDHPRDVAGDPDLLNITRPEVVLGIHRDYFAAGADIATTNTFTATTIGQADYALEDAAYEMSLEGARLARQAADELDRPAWVAGSIGPLNVSLSVSPRVDDPTYRSHTFDQVVETYASQIRALVEGGVDLLLIETIFDTLNAKAAVAAALDVAPFREVDLHDLAGHLGLDAHRGVRLHVAHRGDLERDHLLLRGGHAHGHGGRRRRRLLGAGAIGTPRTGPGQGYREREAGHEAAHHRATSAAASTSASRPLSTPRRSSADMRWSTASRPRICMAWSSCTRALPGRVSSSTYTRRSAGSSPRTTNCFSSSRSMMCVTAGSVTRNALATSPMWQPGCSPT